MDIGFLWSFTRKKVVAEIAHIHATVIIDHEIVEITFRPLRQVGIDLKSSLNEF
ncbi:hypothetical protein D3C72_2289030 [compost metagenome]